MIYLDNHTITQPCKSALERMQPYFETHWGQINAPHRMGADLHHQVESRKSVICDFFFADPSVEFHFTSSGAEAINQVLWSVFTEKARKDGKTHFIATSSSDLPTMASLKRLEELGCTVKIAPLDENGQVDLEALRSLINPRTAIISASVADGLTGVIQPYEEIAEIAKSKGCLLHLDANYGVGKMPLSFVGDYMTFSGELIHSTKGSGGVLVADSAPLIPFVSGGDGSLNVPAFMALCASFQQSSIYLDSMALEVVRLRDLFELLVEGTVLYQNELRLPNVSMIAFEKVHHDALLYFLSRKGVYASIGGNVSPRVSDETAISFALSRMTTEEEVRQAAQIINETAGKLQVISEGI